MLFRSLRHRLGADSKAGWDFPSRCGHRDLSIGVSIGEIVECRGGVTGGKSNHRNAQPVCYVEGLGADGPGGTEHYDGS